MKTFHSEQLGFEIDIPDEWELAPNYSTSPKVFFQLGCYAEAFNFEVGPLFPERLLEYTEYEFRQYAHQHSFHELVFGRIIVAGKQHVCAHYHVLDGQGERWNKKYMLVFGATEYAVTGTCNDPQYFARREKDWDAIISTFRLMAGPKFTEELMKARRAAAAGPLYALAYEAAGQSRYEEARSLLEECLSQNPHQVLPLKELAFVLRYLGDLQGSLSRRWEVKRLDPSDTVNRYNIVGLLSALGDEAGALREVEELLSIEPGNPEFQAAKARLVKYPLRLSYPEYYQQQAKQFRGDNRYLKLISSAVAEDRQGTHIKLVYRWNATLSHEEAFRLDRRARAYLACAIYNVALNAGLACRAWDTAPGEKPAWQIGEGPSPVTLNRAEFNFLDSTCQVEIGSFSPGSGALCAKLQEGFKLCYDEISV